VPLTVADLADHINAPTPAAGTQAQREMQRALDTAVQETTRRTGMLDGVTVTVTATVDVGDRALRLPYVRLASIDAVTDPAGAAADASGADPLAGIIPVTYLVAAGTYGLSGGWQVTCTGRPWPAALVTSALDWAAHLYDVQRITAQPVDSDEPPPSFSLPNRVEELQRPYLLAGVA
jgi:hypothetical protein